MISKNELKYIQSLCHKKQRQQQGLFIVEGNKIVTELLQSNYTIKQLYALPEWIKRQKNITANVNEITESELAKISLLQTPNEVVAIVEQPITLSQPLLKNQISIVLDGIQDPGNLGTIIRIADWFGIKQIVASEDTVELYNPKVIQSTMGSFIRVNVFYTSLENFFINNSVNVFAATLDGNNFYNMHKLTEGILLIGNESKGIRNHLLPFINYKITIPKKGEAESLNAAVATGIILSHII